MLLARGDFETIRSHLVSQALTVEPSDFLTSLREDGWWVGTPWFELAQTLYVQNQMWVEDGWNMPWAMFRGLIEWALYYHDRKMAPPSSSNALCAALVPYENKFQRDLNRIRRFPCISCGCVMEDGVRPPRRRGMPMPRREIYCTYY